MSNNSLLFVSQARNLLNASEAERETFPTPARLDVGAEATNDCTLPVGIESLEHWLDLNA